MTNRRDAIAEDLRALAEDFRSLLDSATTDPKERRRMELRWRLLYSARGAVTELAARRAATKAWTVLTGESPPLPAAAQAASPPQERREQPELVSQR